jgi:hypothetical protein
VFFRITGWKAIFMPTGGSGHFVISLSSKYIHVCMYVSTGIVYSCVHAVEKGVSRQQLNVNSKISGINIYVGGHGT